MYRSVLPVANPKDRVIGCMIYWIQKERVDQPETRSCVSCHTSIGGDRFTVLPYPLPPYINPPVSLRSGQQIHLGLFFLVSFRKRATNVKLVWISSINFGGSQKEGSGQRMVHVGKTERDGIDQIKCVWEFGGAVHERPGPATTHLFSSLLWFFGLFVERWALLCSCGDAVAFTGLSWSGWRRHQVGLV